MANPTTNFGWVMPTSASLVTNLPADFNVFGQAVDTSMQYLLGGTTGQVLSKTSGTNMAFTWTTPTDQTPLTTKGDLFGYSTLDARIPIGTNNQVLTADSAQALGLKWATPSGGGKVLQVVYGSTSTAASNSTTTFADTNLTATITPTLNTSKVLVLVVQQNVAKDAGNASSQLTIKLMRDATSLGQFVNGQLYTGTTVNNYQVATINYLDSPATTSATTYKTTFANLIAAASVKVQADSQGISTILLLEIGA